MVDGPGGGEIVKDDTPVMNYLEHITTYFVSLVGRGVSLSSRDVALVRQWEQLGVPAPVVCRALRMAHQRLGPRAARSLSLADGARYLERMAAAGPAPAANAQKADDAGPGQAAQWTPAALLGDVAAAGRDAPEGPLKETYRNLYRAVRALPPQLPLTVTEISRLDDLAVSDLLRRLPKPERSRIRAEARRTAARLMGTQASRQARQRLAKSLTEREVCARHGLSLPSALLIRENDNSTQR